MKQSSFHHRKPNNDTPKLLGSIREIVFGLEDSLVSTIGVLAGIAGGTGDKKIVVLSGLVLVVVEALSMAAGSFLSSQSHRRLMMKKIRDKEIGREEEVKEETPLISGIVMGVVYVLGGLILIVPFLLFSVPVALMVSFSIAGIGLFSLGIWSGWVTGDRKIQTGLEMVFVSAGAALIGWGIGRLVGGIFGISV